MAGWYWTNDAHTQVDPILLAEAGVRAGLAADSVQQARWYLSSVPSNWATASTVLALAPGRLDLYADVRDLEQRINESLPVINQMLTELGERLEDYSRWLEMASLIYASAEQEVTVYQQTCALVSRVECSINPGNLTGIVASVPSYIKAMTTGVEGVSVGIDAQHQFRGVFGTNSGSAATASSAAKLAGLWNVAALLCWGASSGVVVQGPRGAAWARLQGSGEGKTIARVHLSGANVELPEGWTHVNHPVSRAWALSAEAVGQDAGAATILRTVTKSISGAIRHAVPLSAAALLQELREVPTLKQQGLIRILRHDAPGREPTWTVLLRGTQQWLPGTSNPQDMQTNLQEVAGQVSDSHIAALLAMELAGIKPGHSVEFVGHSQGGAVALSLAASEEVVERYNVVAVLTAGGPVGATPKTDVQVLALENLADVVPALDGICGSVADGHQVVYFDAGATPGLSDVGAHSLETYVQAAAALDRESTQAMALEQYAFWQEQRVIQMGLVTAGVTTSSMSFAATRVRGSVSVPEPTGGRSK